VICAASLLGAVQLYVGGQTTASAWLATGALVALIWSASRRP
jgi:hypothetical protein